MNVTTFYDTLGSFLVNQAPAIASIVLVFFNDLLSRLYGNSIVWYTIDKSSENDGAQLRNIFDETNEKTKLLAGRVKNYFSYGEVFGLYSSLMASIITVTAFLVKYHSNEDIMITPLSYSLIVIITSIILLVVYSFSILKLKYDIKNGKMHVNAQRVKTNKWKIKYVKIIILVSNVLVIVLGGLIEGHFRMEVDVSWMKDLISRIFGN